MPPFKYMIKKTRDIVRVGFDLKEDHLTLKYLGVDASNIPAAERSLDIFRSKVEDTKDDKLT